MNFEAEKLSPSACGFPNSLRQEPFWIIKVIFNRSNPFDRFVLKRIYKQSCELREKVISSSANDSATKRTPDRILSNSIAGVLSEYCWKNAINLLLTRTSVFETPYDHGKEQIDLISKNKKLRIEVRSSFPRNGIEFALFHPEGRFDILGPYANEYKRAETNKDFYLRVLYHVSDHSDFSDKYLNSNTFEVYLTGGASHEMMENSQICQTKNLRPEDEDFDVESVYKVIPFEHALDSMEIIKAIIDKDDNCS